ncbi:hypothetical protein OAF63_02925 [Saprospiraceae bacterium]|jgi:hypothetical protein|nr:hypothetical protein [Saprospiraceae bacterium]
MKTCLLIMKYFSTVHFLRVVKNAVKDGERITKRETFGEKIEDFFTKGLPPKEIFAPQARGF